MTLQEISKSLQEKHKLVIDEDKYLISIEIEIDLKKLMEIENISIKSHKLVKMFNKFNKTDDKYLDILFNNYKHYNTEDTVISICVSKIDVVIIIEHRDESN